MTPIARTCDLFLPIKPGRDVALFNGILHLMIENDWLDHDFIEQHTVGFDDLAAHVQRWTPRHTAEVTGIAEKGIRQAAEWWGQAKTSFLMHARGIEHHSHGVQNVLGAINIVLASGRIGRENCGYGTITGQANGQGGREHGQKCDQLPGGRDLGNPEHRAYVASVWGIDPDELPQPGVDAYEIFRKVDRGEIRGLLSVCFNPVVSLPDNNFIRRMLEKLEFFVAIDFFLNETARYADVVLPGSLQEEDEGTVTQLEGRVIKINKAVACPGEAREDWRIIQDIAKALGRERGLTFDEPARDVRGAEGRVEGRHRRLLGHHLGARRGEHGRVLALPGGGAGGRDAAGAAGHAAPLRARLVEPGGQGARPVLLPRRQGPLQRVRLHAAGRGRGRRVPDHPHHRSRGEPVPVGHPDAADRAARRSLPRAPPGDPPPLAARLGIAGRRLGHRRVAPRHVHAAGRGGAHHPARHRLHPLSLGRAARAPTSSRSRRRIRSPRSPNTRSAPSACARPTRRPTTPTACEPQQ